MRDWIKSWGISYELSDHVMNKKHKFNDKCGADCIFQVANDVCFGSSCLDDNGIKSFEELDIVDMVVK